MPSYIVETTAIIHTSYAVYGDDEDDAILAYHSGDAIEADQWVEEEIIGEIYEDNFDGGTE